MEDAFVILLTGFIIFTTVLYIIMDIHSMKRIENAENELGVCSKKINSFNNDFNSIQQRLTSIENRLNNVESKINTHNGCSILHD